MIVLNKSSDALNTPDEKNKLNRFVVVCGQSGRGFEMKADSAMQKTEWLHAIRKVCNTFKPQYNLTLQKINMYA